MEQLERLVRAVDDFQQRHRWLAFPVAVVKKYGEDQAGHRAALLAYYGFFSLFPLLLVAVTVLGFVLQGQSDLGQRIVDSAVAQFPVIGDEISGTVSQSRLRGSGLALAVGLGLALWGGLGVAGWPGWSSSGAGCCWPAWSRGSRRPPTPPGRGRPGWQPRPP
jgi:membrane protein